MEASQEALQPGVVREVEGDLRAELLEVRTQMEKLTHQHQRAVVMRRIFEHDPLTRDRFNMLHEHIDQYPGKMAELREQERLLTRWLDRCHAILDDKAA